MDAGDASLSAVPDLLLAELRLAGRGVVVLAVDGLPYDTAARCWPGAPLRRLASTVPSTSTTGWLTALTGAGPGEHGTAGMVYRVPAHGTVVYAVTGRVLARGPADDDGHGLVVPLPTVFDRARTGADCLVLGRELDHLTGPWAAALLSGASRVRGPAPAALAAAAADPLLLVEQAAAQVGAVLDNRHGERPLLLWAYLNLDDHLHRHGPDARTLAAMRRLGGYAERWAGAGWTVVCHSDHGQVRSAPDPRLAAGWDDLERRECALPSGGAGRMRWMYPRPGRARQVAERLADLLGDAALVVPADGLAGLGGPPLTPLLRGRIGSVVALAATERFPVPDPSLRFEHGALHPDEVAVPFVTWRA